MLPFTPCCHEDDVRSDFSPALIIPGPRAVWCRPGPPPFCFHKGLYSCSSKEETEASPELYWGGFKEREIAVGSLKNQWDLWKHFMLQDFFFYFNISFLHCVEKVEVNPPGAGRLSREADDLRQWLQLGPAAGVRRGCGPAPHATQQVSA